jgi:hypothetical protein
MPRVILNFDITIDDPKIREDLAEHYRESAIEAVEKFINTQENENYLRRIMAANLIRNTDSTFEEEVCDEISRDIDNLVEEELKYQSEGGIFLSGQVFYTIVDEEDEHATH